MSEGDDGRGGGYGAPGAETGAGAYDASGGRTLVSLTTAIGLACGGGPAPEGIDGGAPDGTAPYVLKPESEVGLAHADELEREARADRALVILLLQKPEGWDGTAKVWNPARSREPLVDTTESRTVNPQAVREVRGMVAVTLNLTCREAGSTRVFVDLGRQEGVSAKWRLALTTRRLMQTFFDFETGQGLPPDNLLRNLRVDPSSDLIPGQASNLAFGLPRQLIGDELLPTASGRVKNTSDQSQVLTVKSDDPRIFVAGGVDSIPTDQPLVLEPGQSVEVVAYPPDASATQAHFEVQLTDVPAEP